MLLSDLVDSYIQYMANEYGASPLTVRNYAHWLKRMLDYLGDMPTKRLDFEHVRNYHAHLASTGMSRSTQAYHANALRSLLKYGMRNGVEVMSYERITVPQYKRPVVAYLEPEEVARMLDVVDLGATGGMRDKAILETLYATGLRLHELTSLNRTDIDLDSRQFTVTGKGGKIRVVFLTPRAATWLSQYLLQRTDNSDALFVEYASGEYNRIADRGVQRIVKQAAWQAGIEKKITPHSLRHSMASNLLNKGVDIRAIQEFLGHSSIMTTQYYTHITSPQLKSLHDKHMSLEEE